MSNSLFIETLGSLNADFSSRLSMSLFHFLWQGALIGLLVRMAYGALRSASAQSRYCAGVIGLFAMAGCLPVTYLLLTGPSQSTANWRSRDQQVRSIDSGVHADRMAAAQLKRKTLADTITDLQPGNKASEDPTSALSGEFGGRIPQLAVQGSRAPRLESESLATCVALAYLAGVALMLGRLTCGLWGARRLRNLAELSKDPTLLTLLRRQAKRLGMSAVPPVALCKSLAAPAVLGIVRPIILLPTALTTGLTPDQLQAVLTHELAHVHRWDLLINHCQRLIEAALFFHPLVWWVSRRVSEERENCCDDWVVSSGCTREQYAMTLIQLAETAATSLRVKRHPLAATLVANGLQATPFNRRVLRLLDREPHGHSSRALPMLVLLGLILLVLGPVISPIWLGGVVANAETRLQTTQNESGRAPRNLHLATDLYGDSLPVGTVLRLGTIRMRHPAYPSVLAFSANGRLLASGGSESVRIWDPATGVEIARIPQAATSLRFSPVGDHLAIGGADGAVRYISTADGEQIQMVQPPGHRGYDAVKAFEFLKDGRWIAMADGNGDVSIVDTDTKAEVGVLHHGWQRQTHMVLAASPDGSLIATASGANIRIWDVDAGFRFLWMRNVGHGKIRSLVFALDSKTLLSGSIQWEDATGADAADRVPHNRAEIRAWNVESQDPVGKKIHEARTDQTLLLALRGDHNSLIGLTDTQLLDFNLATQTLRQSVAIPTHRFGIVALAVSPDGLTMVTVAREAAIDVTDAKTAQSRSSVADAHTAEVTAIAYSPDGRQILTGSPDGTVRLWDSNTGRLIRRFEYASCCMRLQSVSYAHNGKYIAAVGAYSNEAILAPVGSVKVWNAESGALIREIQLDQGSYASVALSSNGDMIAIAPDVSATAMFRNFVRDRSGGTLSVEELNECPIYVYQVQSGERLLTLEGHQRTVSTLAFALDGMSLISVAERESIRTWSLPSGELTQSISARNVRSAAVSYDRNWVATSALDHTAQTVRVTIWDLASGHPVREIDLGPGEHTPRAMDISMDGHYLVTLGGGAARVWEVKSGRLLMELEVPDVTIQSVAFHPSNQAVVTGMNDATALVWDVSSVLRGSPPHN